MTASTSIAARVASGGKAIRLRAEILDYLRRNGPRTDQELQVEMQIEQNSQRPRRVELVQAGLVRPSGMKRRVKSGCLAIVWEACEIAPVLQLVRPAPDPQPERPYCDSVYFAID